MKEPSPVPDNVTYHPGDSISENWHIVRLLGSGSYGQVYLAENNSRHELKRAVKVLRRDDTGVSSGVYQDAVRRFNQEASLGANHKFKKNPYLLEVYDFFPENDHLTMWMDYAPGGSLAERLSECKEKGLLLPVEQAVNWGLQIAEGLAALHDPAIDVVHRDLHPGNILFDSTASDAHALVADLGLAQMPGAPSSRYLSGYMSAHPGHPSYRSPEHENPNRALTPAADVYVLGMLLFEMLTGQRYINHEGKHVRAMRKDVPLWLDTLIFRMLSRDPLKRPQNGSAVAKLLRRKEWHFPTWLLILIGLAILGGAASQIPFDRINWPTIPAPSTQPVVKTEAPIQMPTATEKPAITPTAIPSPTVTASLVPTNTYVPTSTSTRKPVKDPVSMTLLDNGNVWVDDHIVRKEMFATFIKETGYKTDAESGAGGWVGGWYKKHTYKQATWCSDPACTMSSGFSWELITNASWEFPIGRGYIDDSSYVRQVSWNDASKYCEWAGKRLPTKSERDSLPNAHWGGEWVRDSSVFDFPNTENLISHLHNPTFRSTDLSFRCALDN